MFKRPRVRSPCRKLRRARGVPPVGTLARVRACACTLQQRATVHPTSPHLFRHVSTVSLCANSSDGHISCRMTWLPMRCSSGSSTGAHARFLPTGPCARLRPRSRCTAAAVRSAPVTAHVTAPLLQQQPPHLVCLHKLKIIAQKRETHLAHARADLQCVMLCDSQRQHCSV